MRFAFSKFCIGVLLNVILCSCSEEKILGYGTKFGTLLEEESKKVIGLGAAPGFLSGDNEADILEVYQRYKLYRALAEQEEGLGGEAAECGELCPAGAHCAWGLCFCDPDFTVENLEVGMERKDSNDSVEFHPVGGICLEKRENRTFSPRLTMDLEEVFSCNETSECQTRDINFVCLESTCVCRDNMRYDKQNSKCSIYLEVDCSSFTIDTPVSGSLQRVINGIIDGNLTTENEVIPESLLAYLDPVSTGMFSAAELEEAFCRDVHHLSINFGDRQEFLTLELLVVGLGVMVVVLLLVLGCLILSGCVCWCCFESCRRKLENFLSPNSYSQDLKSGSVTEKEDGDQLVDVMPGYQPVPQHPPPSYPQGSASLPRGCAPPSKNASLPRMGASASKSGSLARGVSPIPRAYPALAEAPPGYPESPQKTGPPPLGYPLSPPEYPQTPTPPGFPGSNSSAKTTKPLYPQIPEK